MYTRFELQRNTLPWLSYLSSTLNYISYLPQNATCPNHYHLCIVSPWSSTTLQVLECKHLIVKLLFLWSRIAACFGISFMAFMFCLLFLIQVFNSCFQYFVVCLHRLSINLHLYRSLLTTHSWQYCTEDVKSFTWSCCIQNFRGSVFEALSGKKEKIENRKNLILQK